MLFYSCAPLMDRITALTDEPLNNAPSSSSKNIYKTKSQNFLEPGKAKP